MAATSVTDSRTVIMVERLLKNGYIIRSLIRDDQFSVTIVKGGELGRGYGATFPAAFYSAVADLRDIRLLPRVALWRH